MSLTRLSRSVSRSFLKGLGMFYKNKRDLTRRYYLNVAVLDMESELKKFKFRTTDVPGER